MRESRLRAISISLYLNTDLCPVTRFHNIETTERVIRLLLLALVSDLCAGTNGFRIHDTLEIFGMPRVHARHASRCYQRLCIFHYPTRSDKDPCFSRIHWKRVRHDGGFSTGSFTGERRISRWCASSPVCKHMLILDARCDSRVRNKLVPRVNARSRFRLYGDLEYPPSRRTALVADSFERDKRFKLQTSWTYAICTILFLRFLPLYVREILICVTSFRCCALLGLAHFTDDTIRCTNNRAISDTSNW